MQFEAPDNFAPMLMLQPILNDMTVAVKSTGSHFWEESGPPVRDHGLKGECQALAGQPLCQKPSW